MSDGSMKITIPIAILLFLVGIVVSFFGWMANKTLTDINGNITILNLKIDQLTDIRYEHETRLKLLEKEIESKNKEKSK